jgi:acetoin utilization deacetylase AcuC-like enzyme
MECIRDKFEPDTLVVSLGLDTYDGHQVAIRRAGFHLKEDDYKEIGRIIGILSPKRKPIVVMQEGGYLMTVIGQAASDVVTGVSFSE